MVIEGHAGYLGRASAILGRPCGLDLARGLMMYGQDEDHDGLLATVAGVVAAYSAVALLIGIAIGTFLGTLF